MVSLQVTIGDATKPLASRIWENWMPFGSEASEAEVVDVAWARVPLADVLAAGKASGTWKLSRPDKLGQVCFLGSGGQHPYQGITQLL